jgi:hypothetical protein
LGKGLVGHEQGREVVWLSVEDASFSNTYRLGHPSCAPQGLLFFCTSSSNHQVAHSLAVLAHALLQVKTTQFMLDWQRIASKARFRKTLLRALMNNPNFSNEVSLLESF